ncbi:MAG: hypothetical protein WAV40_03315 [Microgenomates group bacterium]
MKLIKFFCFIIVVLVIGNVTLTNRSVDESLVVANLSRDISALQNENTILKSEVASAGSIVELSSKIEAAGFISSGKVAALPSVSSVASR